jgi:hypothetical protein
MLNSFDMALGAVVVFGVVVFGFVCAVALLTRQKPAAQPDVDQYDMDLQVPSVPSKPAKPRPSPYAGVGAR